MFSVVEEDIFYCTFYKKGNRQTHTHTHTHTHTRTSNSRIPFVALPVNTAISLLFPSTKTFLFCIISYNFLHT